ncbi:MAG: hypothetical protein GYA33_07960 [Thermogutta sp.]|nr:hypothetical protein [Thermogutta sp.]
MDLLLVLAAAACAGVAQPNPPPETPGPAFTPPAYRTSPEAPLVYCHTEEAGPDQSFLLVGERLTSEVVAWGVDPHVDGGRELQPRVQLVHDGTLTATLPERAFDGPVVVWVKNGDAYSEPVVLNAPRPWWSAPGKATPGATVRIFGRNLARRPDFARAFVYLCPAGKPGRWLPVISAGKYQLQVHLPADVAAGEYQLWVHAGKGGPYGWGGPLTLTVDTPTPAPAAVPFAGGDLQEAVDRLARAGGGILQLPAGVVELTGTLVVPAGVTVLGAGRDKTVLQSPADPALRLDPLWTSAWNQGPSAVHTVGDKIKYKVEFPKSGTWQVWLRYATEMSPWNLPGVSNHMTLALEGGPTVALDNLPNTGSFSTFRWSRSAAMEIPAGTQQLVWENVKGGGIHIDALVFALDADFTPGDQPFPISGERVVVVQGEEAARFESKEGSLPGIDQAAVWLAGDGAGVADLTICGTPRTNIGIAVRSPHYPAWLRDCRIERVMVRDCEGKQAENCGLRLFHAEDALVRDNEFWGRAPIFMSGVRRCELSANRLVSVTLWGGNSEAYILGRNETVRQCILEDNVCACPPGAEGGGPTGRRLIWLSTGRGSVDLNWIAGNREDRARFGGVAGTDQNVGEMILFEACERIAYFGPIVGAEAQSVTLPARLPPTPDDRLGNVRREQLAHDAEGNETPFWPPDVDDGTPEAPVSEYFVTVLGGRGLGQTRRVVGRRGETYQLEEPWRVAPQPGSVILVHTAYWRNHLVDNRTVDGMTGVQLWIACIENVLSGNTVQRCRKPGLYLFGLCSTLASSMPMTWNRGIGPLYFNHIEGTRCDETSCGALLISGERPDLPVEFPRCLGNVLRHNSFVRSRTDGVLITGNRPPDEDGPTSAVLGTIVEFNLVRDARTGYHVASSAEATLLRRNHAYFWYPVDHEPGPRTAFQLDNPKAAQVVEQNSVEGIHGVKDANVIEVQQGPRP